MSHGARDRGAVYVAVLATATLAAIMVVAGTIAATAAGRGRKAAAQADDARAQARAGLELLASRAANTAAWRASLKDGTGLASVSIGGGKVAFSAADPVDGDPSSGWDDPVTLSAEATEDRARQKYSITLTPRAAPGAAMGRLIAAGGNLTFLTAWVDGDIAISANGNITSTASYIVPDVQAGGTVTGTGFAGATRSLAGTISIPTFAEASAYWVSIGTGVPYASIASQRIRRAVVGPTRGPVGGYTNTDGVYVIDCGGNDLAFSECRIVGTIVLKNCGTCSLTDAVLWQPLHPGWPALIVDGQLTINNTTMPVLKESSAGNLNPAGLPYLGVSDSDNTDNYPPVICGIVYAKTSIKMTGSVTVNGWVMSPGSVTVGASGGLGGLAGGIVGGVGSIVTANFSHVITLRQQRVGTGPMGFRESPDFRAVDGSFARLVD